MTSRSITDRWERRGPEGRVRTARWGKGMRYLARYRDAAGREHTKSFPDRQKAAAQRWLDEVTAAVVTGQYVDPRNARQSVRRYAQRWEQVQVGRPATLSIVDNALRLHILPALGDMPIGAVQKSDVQALVKRAGSSGLSPRSVRNVYDVMTRMFAAAVDDRVIPSTPCRGISLPSVSREEISPLTAAEVEALADAMGFHRAPVLVLAGTGLRIGELLGLDVRHVDFLRRTIKVERQLTQAGEYGPTKTAESARTVPIGQATISVLAAHLEGRVPEGPLFTDEFGRPLSYGVWKARWKSATSSVGIDATTHDLRHFTASALIAGGASVKQVQTFLGHSSATITLRVYAHLWPGDDDRTRSIIDAVLLRDADQVRTESSGQTYSTRSGG